MPNIIRLNEGIVSIGKTHFYSIYTVNIDTSNSNPLTCCTYADDATGMIAGSNDWQNTVIFRNIKPCLLKNGVVQYYLDSNNLLKKKDGTNSILTGTDGDVMIEVPKLGVRIHTENNIISISITDNPKLNGFNYYAHTINNDGDKSKIYIGAFLGNKDTNNKLRSIAGVTPINNLSLTDARVYASNNGQGYRLMSFYAFTLIQCLYLLKYKNLNSQAVFGMGYVNKTAITTTGSTVSKGIDFAENTGTQQLCFQNIEDVYGNLLYFIDGLYCDSNHNILTATNNFNNTGEGYVNCGTTSSDLQGWLSNIQGETSTGFLAKKCTGSSSTFFCDYSRLVANTFASAGGGYNDFQFTGMFYINCFNSIDFNYGNLGARLMYI